ncbi:MAG: M20 family metallo-hydrolase [Thermoplasmata archaeon]|nr:M20 family metallo-hydrolase [Thermoplasmata archaeon]
MNSGNSMQDLSQPVENLKDEMILFLTEMCRIRAIAPDSGGDGEYERCQYIQTQLDRMGFQNIEIIKAEDGRVSAGYRPNIIITLPGSDASLPPIWVISHMDIVPEGDLNHWKTDPYDPIQKEGKLYGRGVEDNGQSLTASLFAAKALLDSGQQQKRTVKVAFVADEEVGSKFGIQYLLKQNIFTKEDLIVVPDAGSPDGSKIEVVEKSHLQLKVITHGKQTHASRPHKGINAFRAASKFVARVCDELYEMYASQNPLFEPPFSTFEATKKESNVPNVNTIPGEDVFYMDCRILPTEDLDEILNVIRGIAKDIEKQTGATITFENVSMSRAPPATPHDSPIVKKLQQALKEVHGIEAGPIGIGGGTCAAHFRKEGLPAVVWETNDELAHEPNEYTKIDNLVNDSKIFARLYQL